MNRLIRLLEISTVGAISTKNIFHTHHRKKKKEKAAIQNKIHSRLTMRERGREGEREREVLDK